jgi:hypothetical protein
VRERRDPIDPTAGDTPNRGFLQADINLHSIRYLQPIQDAHVLGPNGKPAGIHIEPRLWINAPQTTDRQDAPTVARMANIPHGASMVARGSELPVIHHAPPIGPASITPFTIAPPHTPIQFPETNLGIPSQFRTPPGDIPNVTQAMVNNPNLVLSQAIAGKNIVSTTTLRISTSPLNPPTSGGGTDNIAFLQGYSAAHTRKPRALRPSSRSKRGRKRTGRPSTCCNTRGPCS